MLGTHGAPLAKALANFLDLAELSDNGVKASQSLKEQAAPHKGDDSGGDSETSFSQSGEGNIDLNPSGNVACSRPAVVVSFRDPARSLRAWGTLVSSSSIYASEAFYDRGSP